jgi:mannose-6-phosphate isomerase-like protein (cupin superfamily)
MVYFVEGSDEVLMEVGETKLRLKPGDSVLAPRNVPHVWAYLGQQPGADAIRVHTRGQD